MPYLNEMLGLEPCDHSWQCRHMRWFVGSHVVSTALFLIGSWGIRTTLTAGTVPTMGQAHLLWAGMFLAWLVGWYVMLTRYVLREVESGTDAERYGHDEAGQSAR